MALKYPDHEFVQLDIKMSSIKAQRGIYGGFHKKADKTVTTVEEALKK